MKTLHANSTKIFLELVKNVTLLRDGKCKNSDKLAFSVYLLVEYPDTPLGRVGIYIIGNHQQAHPFVPEMSFFLVDRQKDGEVDLEKISIVPRYAYLGLKGREVSAEFTGNREIEAYPELNTKHCIIADTWLANLELGGYTEEFDESK